MIVECIYIVSFLDPLHGTPTYQGARNETSLVPRPSVWYTHIPRVWERDYVDNIYMCVCVRLVITSKPQSQALFNSNEKLVVDLKINKKTLVTILVRESCYLGYLLILYDHNTKATSYQLYCMCSFPESFMSLPLCSFVQQLFQIYFCGEANKTSETITVPELSEKLS